MVEKKILSISDSRKNYFLRKKGGVESVGAFFLLLSCSAWFFFPKLCLIIPHKQNQIEIFFIVRNEHMWCLKFFFQDRLGCLTLSGSLSRLLITSGK